jgi:hypothetical protein
MINVLLIEDRPERKSQFLKNWNIDSLSPYSFLKEISNEELIMVKNDLADNNTSLISGYDLLMTHKSALTQVEQDIISTLNISIVYFSGGISQSFYAEYPNPVLHINSNSFYSQNLITFLDNISKNNSIEMLILQFGEKWKLNLLLRLRDELYQKLYSHLDDKIFPEDFDDLFDQKIMLLNWGDDVKREFESLKLNGLDKDIYQHFNVLIKYTSNYIANEIGLII